jgi:hypothetical protein
MIKSTQIFIPIPKTRNTHGKVEINGLDMTKRIIDSSWVLPVTKGVGTFNIKVSNANGQYSSSFNRGEIVKFYADNVDGTTLQFWGRIDYVKDDLTTDGQYLNIEGRHRSFYLNEFYVCYSAIDTVTSQILKGIIAELPSSQGFTSSNVQDDATLMSVNWNYKPFWDCIIELCNQSGFDCYVDNNLDFHYFLANSIVNNGDAVVEGDNLIKGEDIGTNDYYAKSRVVASGQDDAGLPIIYTAISESETDVKEMYVNDSSADTYEKVRDIANAKLAEVETRYQQSKVKSFGLETVNPGDNIWFIMPRQKVAGQYKLSQITHSFGMDQGGWRTELITEHQESGTHIMIKNIKNIAEGGPPPNNPHKLNYSYNFDFNEDVGTHSNTVITEGVLKTDGASSGLWISPVRSLISNIQALELRIVGEELVGNIVVSASTDGGAVYHPVFGTNTYSFSTSGNNLRIRINFYSASSKVESIALLYS